MLLQTHKNFMLGVEFSEKQAIALVLKILTMAAIAATSFQPALLADAI